MSRSYRKPWYVDSYGSKVKKFFKRQASRAVRNALDVPNGKAYRKYYDPYKIVDWKSLYDPNPWWFDLKQEWVEPHDPEWKAWRK